MAEMRVGGDDKQQQRPISRTSCCGAGAHGLIYGVYLVLDPSDSKPTTTAERIGGFRGCSKCFKPLGDVAFKPGCDIPRSVWIQMVERADPEKGDKYGTTAYYAQRNADGTVTLYNWNANPTVRRLNAARSLDKGLEHTGKPPRAESLEQKKARALEQARLFDEPKQEDKRANAYEPEAPEFPAGDAQEPGNAAGDNPDQGLEPCPFA